MMAIGVVALAVGIAACGPISLTTAPWSQPQAVIQSALFGNRNVTFDQPPVISVAEGRIQSVTVSGPEGQRVGGKVIDGGSGWQIDTADLDFGTKYSVSATAVDLRGQPTSADATFRTFVPDKQLAATTNLVPGETYGVAMPIMMTFDAPVSRKAQIERRLLVTTNTKAPLEGSWNWDSDTAVTYRPRQFWPADTTVTLDADIKGVDAGHQTYATENKTETFKIGDSFIMYQDSAKYRMTVKRNGKRVRVIPTSTGRSGYETRSGIKPIMTKEYHTIADSATIGIPPGSPDYYKLDLYYAMRVTWSGEYVHSAPWSVGSQGNANVSHGCINVGPDNAAWLYNQAHVGDPLIVKNTGVPQDLGNGWTMWNESWTQWKQGSALNA